MHQTVRIGNAHGFWGDRLEAASEMLALQPDLDYLTLDFLAEVSMSILAAQKKREPSTGYAKDFVDVVASLVPYWKSGGKCKLVTNAGGLSPLQCAMACRETLERGGCSGLAIAVVSGDDVREFLQADSIAQANRDHYRNLDTGAAINDVMDRMLTANAYLGAAPIADALSRGADLVITGRVADPSLTVGPCLHHFGWKTTDYSRIAGATIAGHLIECGTQVTGGISTDWLSVPRPSQIGFPLVEVDSQGGCIVTKAPGSGGCVTEATVKEQLLYEIGDPGDYLSPDARVSFLSLSVSQEGSDRVRVSGAKGGPPTDTLKVSATYQDGYRAAGQLVIFGSDALTKAKRAADIVLQQLERSGVTLANRTVEAIGAAPGSVDDASSIVLRIAVADPSKESVQQFTRAMTPLITAGPPGTTGYADGRPRVHPLIGYWPCLIGADRVKPDVQMVTTPAAMVSNQAKPAAKHEAEPNRPQSTNRPPAAPTGLLCDIAVARSGDKGRGANIGVIARHPDDYPRLQKELSLRRVAAHLGVNVDAVSRYELPNLSAINFVISGILANPLRFDAQGKTLGQTLLQLPLEND